MKRREIISEKQTFFYRSPFSGLTSKRTLIKAVELALKVFKGALTVTVVMAVCALLSAAPLSNTPRSSSGAHVPAAGSAERKAITDGLRGDQKVVFKIHYLKVHGDWAWIDVTPLDEKGKAVAEGGTSLMHKESGVWKAMDLSGLPEDPDNPMQEPTAKFIKQLQKKFPGLPSDIFPRRTK